MHPVIRPNLPRPSRFKDRKQTSFAATDTIFFVNEQKKIIGIYRISSVQRWSKGGIPALLFRKRNNAIVIKIICLFFDF